MIHQTLKLQYRPALRAILLLELCKLFFEGFITYRIAGYLHWKLFSRTWKNSLGAEMLTEEKFAKRAKALIMIMLI